MKYEINTSLVIKEELDNNEKKYIFYDLDRDKIFVFNDSAHEIFTLIKTLNSKEDVINLLISKYKSEYPDLLETVDTAIISMLEKGIILKKD